MIETLLIPLRYAYMAEAIWIAGLVGLLCGALSAFLMLKGWSLIGDALSHAIVPGVAGAVMLGLPFALGAFLSGGLAAMAMLFLNNRTGLREDAVIGLILTGFFGLGLFMISLNPVAVSLSQIVQGNILTLAPGDVAQLLVIAGGSLAVIALRWRDLAAVFFDETHARTVGLRPRALKVMFFAILAAATVAAMQTVGAFLVVALVITPGAAAYLLADRFGAVLLIAAGIGGGTAWLGAYLSFFLDGATGGVIVVMQTLVFLLAFLFAPKHGWLAQRRAG